jgi:uncharacterized protein YfiM (DUF2279 family)
MDATKMSAVKHIFMLYAICAASVCKAQPDSTVNRKKLALVATATGAAYATTMVVLGNAWYSDFDKQSFHWFNDMKEWKQVDKAGHFYSAYYLTAYGSQLLRSCNLPRKKSDRIAAVAGVLMLSSIEIFDGLSSGYGASASDLAFNVAGAAFYLGEAALWKEQRLIPKFSYHGTSFAAIRPGVLGDGASRIIKDYNGQTYWLSADMDKFMSFPKWLNLAVGYGADEMVYGNDEQNTAAGYNAYRQFYLAIDFDLTAIPTKSRFIKTLLQVASMIRLPAPAVEFSRGKVAFHPLYF